MGEMDEGHGAVVQVSRPALTVQKRHTTYHYTVDERPGVLVSARTAARRWCKCSGRRVWSAIKARVPILEWLPSYNPRTALLADVMAGATVGIMHIPQGMAYAVLAALPPVTGLYAAFFPVLLYVLLGTSRHVSMGTVAVTWMMMGKVVGELATDVTTPTMDATAMNATTLDTGDPNATTTIATPITAGYTPTQVATVLALVVGIWEVVLGLLQLGEVFGRFMSDMLISGFTTGVAVHVLTSQFKYLIGVTVPRYNGPFKIIYTYIDLIRQVPSANYIVVIISVVSLAILVVNNELIKPRVKKVTNVPVPMELVVVVLGTAASYFLHLDTNYNVSIVGDIPTGLPSASVPPLDLMPRVLVDGFIIGLVGYTSSFSISKIFAKRHGYTVDATQELYSQGLSNVFGSFFSCGPMAASLSRSFIQEALGGVSLMTALVSCVFILIILLFIGPLFESLPNCVLAAIILAALKGLFLQYRDVIAVWRVSRPDALIWVATFVTSVVVDLDYGLVVGVAASIVALLARSQSPAITKLGRVPNTDLYLDVEKYEVAQEVSGVRIVRLDGPIHFANVGYYRSHLLGRLGLSSPPSPAKRTTAEEKKLTDSPAFTRVCNGSPGRAMREDSPARGRTYPTPEHQALYIKEVSALVLDGAGVTFVDSGGANYLKELQKDLQASGITLCLAALSDQVLEQLERAGLLEALGEDFVFHSIHDAVTILHHQHDAAIIPNQQLADVNRF